MNWYYAENGKQRGPVTEADLAALATQGVINPDSLVWREGLANWIPYRQAFAGGADSPTGSAPGQVLCTECGRAFPPDEVVRHGDVFVCAACKPIFLQKMREGVGATSSMRYGGFLMRTAAKFLDAIIVIVPISVIIGFFTAMLVGRQASGNPILPGLMGFIADFAFFGVYFLYSIFFLGKFGATPGKMATGLRVVNANGSRISYGMAAARTLSEILSYITCLIGYIIAGFDSEKRALHDRICNSRVIYK